MSITRLISYSLAVPAAIIVLFFAGWLWALSNPRAHICVRNESGITLSNLNISGSCEPRHVDTVGGHSEWRTVTRHRDDRQIQLSFLSDAQRYDSIAQIGTNHSGSCGITFTVLSNMTVKSFVVY